METSARTGNNISEIFTVLTESILVKVENQTIDPRNHPGLKVGNEKYLGAKEDLGGKIEKQETLIISK